MTKQLLSKVFTAHSKTGLHKASKRVAKAINSFVLENNVIIQDINANDSEDSKGFCYEVLITYWEPPRMPKSFDKVLQGYMSSELSDEKGTRNAKIQMNAFLNRWFYKGVEQTKFNNVDKNMFVDWLNKHPYRYYDCLDAVLNGYVVV